METAILANSIAAELRKLGHDATLGECERDAYRVNLPDCVIRGVIRASGATKGRIDWGAYAPTNSILHYSYRPMLPSMTTAGDADAKRIAKAIDAKILQPAAEPLAKYATQLQEQRERIAALPAQIEKVRSIGFTAHDAGPAGTEAHIYAIETNRFSGSGSVAHDGRINFNSLSMDAEIGEAVLRLLATYRSAKA